MLRCAEQFHGQFCHIDELLCFCDEVFNFGQAAPQFLRALLRGGGFRYQVELLIAHPSHVTLLRKMLLAEKKVTPFYKFVVHNDLVKQIAQLIEDLEELKSEKKMLLSSFDCSEDTRIAEVKKCRRYGEKFEAADNAGRKIFCRV